jgi:hypothetical protein
MNQRVIVLAGALVLALMTTGCQCLFSSHQSTTQSPWTNWDDVNLAFRQIVPNHTTVKDLQAMKFDPHFTPNIKIVPYVDMVPVFMPNPNIRFKDLPPGVRVYIEAPENNLAYMIDLQNTRDKRHGNLVLDLFGFKRQTHQSGWCFRGIILIKDGTVVYTLSSGEPDISREDSETKPLGPFQDLSGVLAHIVTMAH